MILIQDDTPRSKTPISQDGPSHCKEKEDNFTGPEPKYRNLERMNVARSEFHSLEFLRINELLDLSVRLYPFRLRRDVNV